MWCIPDELSQEYIERMEDILNLYERPLNLREPVICMDEKPTQIHAKVRALIPAKPGRLLRRDGEYIRRGTANVFCAIEPLRGIHITAVTKNRKGSEYAKFLGRIARKYKDAKMIHLVQDNLNTHKLKSLTDFYGVKEGKRIWNRFTVHFTPKHGSWLNMAEIEISTYSRQCLGKERFSEFRELREATVSWNKRANQNGVRIKWHSQPKMPARNSGTAD